MHEIATALLTAAITIAISIVVALIFPIKFPFIGYNFALQVFGFTEFMLLFLAYSLLNTIKKYGEITLE